MIDRPNTGIVCRIGYCNEEMYCVIWLMINVDCPTIDYCSDVTFCGNSDKYVDLK